MGELQIAKLYTSADLAFDPVAHVYTLPDGRQVPSVTQVLKSCGVSTDYDALGELVGHDMLEYRRAVGTAVHADLHADDDGVLDEDTVHPDVRPYLDAWRTFRHYTHVVPVARERRVFDPTRFYCGTLDGVFLAPTGRYVLVDIKTGDPQASRADLQTAAYVAAWAREHPEPISERWAVHLTPGHTVPYRITAYREWRDFQVFAAMVVTFHQQQRRHA